MNFLLVIGGPTASGKTDVAIRLAQHYDTVILSADSRQFYREMSVGTAKPEAAQLAQVRHYFIDSLSIHDPYSVGDFERDALALLTVLFRQHQVVLLTGGSGLFLKALCEGLDEFPETPLSVRQEVEAIYREQGLEVLQQQLKEADPEYYAQVDLHNPHRLIRALAVFRASGKPFSSFRKKAAVKRDFRPIFLELSWDRAALYERINKRVDLMLDNGLESEARQLYPWKNLPALQTVGYQELFSCFDGAISREVAIEQIKQHSRNYAKRQLTWSRRDGYWKHFHPSEWSDILQYLHFSMQNGIQWTQMAFPLEDEGKTGVLRLSAENPLGSLGHLDYWDTRHGWIVLPAPLPAPETAHWLLHEFCARAEGKPVTAFLQPDWTPWLMNAGFVPLEPDSMNERERAWQRDFPHCPAWKKTTSTL